MAQLFEISTRVSLMAAVGVTRSGTAVMVLLVVEGVQVSAGLRRAWRGVGYVQGSVRERLSARSKFCKGGKVKFCQAPPPPRQASSLAARRSNHAEARPGHTRPLTSTHEVPTASPPGHDV
ncbi:hypothetical protein O3P69_014932 [Scylla paramamosain]|uniref:Secreted protein n=1 Tax=Scylla paramamosain TaxID=85552 RepID=A0AAW0TYF9_SCYPA